MHGRFSIIGGTGLPPTVYAYGVMDCVAASRVASKTASVSNFSSSCQHARAGGQSWSLTDVLSPAEYTCRYTIESMVSIYLRQLTDRKIERQIKNLTD